MHGVSLNTLIEAAVTQQPYNHQRLGLQAKRYCTVISGKLCSDLPEDLHDDIFQQAFVELFRIGAGALERLSGLAAFRRAIFVAIRIVRADYAPPGRRTRKAREGAPPERVAAEDIGWIAESEDLQRATVIGTDSVAHIDFDQFESPAAAAALKQVEDRIDADWALRRAPPSVASALRLICLDGVRVDTAAQAMGLDRFKLYREVAAFSAALAAAA